MGLQNANTRKSKPYLPLRNTYVRQPAPPSCQREERKNVYDAQQGTRIKLLQDYTESPQ